MSESSCRPHGYHVIYKARENSELWVKVSLVRFKGFRYDNLFIGICNYVRVGSLLDGADQTCDLMIYRDCADATPGITVISH